LWHPKGLDNLPNEVQHLLTEIKHKESRSQGMFSSCFQYPTIGRYLWPLPNTLCDDFVTFRTRFWFNSNPTQDLQQEIQKETAKYIRHSLRNGTAPVSTKDGQIPQKIKDDYAEVDVLADDKFRLTQRIIDLIARARARLDYDLSKVLVLQGDLDPSQQGSYVMTGRNPVQQINEA